MTPGKTLKVAVIGPKGQCGECVVDELLSRGHSVVGFSRNPPKTWRTPGDFSSVSINVHDSTKFAKLLSDGYDAVVSAYGPPLSDMDAVYEHCIEDQLQIKRAILASKHQGEIIIIGGAGSLYTKEGIQLVDTKDFCYSWWYDWPDIHLDYLRIRAYDHGVSGFSRMILLFKYARNNVEKPSCTFSSILMPRDLH
jgi:putative NADH-flavin reductase